MAFYLDMKPLIDLFGSDLTVYEDTGSGDGEWIDGLWVKNDDPQGTDLFEPFMTFNIYSTLLSGQLMPTEFGESESDKAYWFSLGQYPIGTLVVHNGKRYRVMNKQDYSDYSNVIAYELGTESPNNGEI